MGHPDVKGTVVVPEQSVGPYEMQPYDWAVLSTRYGFLGRTENHGFIELPNGDIAFKEDPQAAPSSMETAGGMLQALPGIASTTVHVDMLPLVLMVSPFLLRTAIKAIGKCGKTEKCLEEAVSGLSGRQTPSSTKTECAVDIGMVATTTLFPGVAETSHMMATASDAQRKCTQEEASVKDATTQGITEMALVVGFHTAMNALTLAGKPGIIAGWCLKTAIDPLTGVREVTEKGWDADPVKAVRVVRACSHRSRSGARSTPDIEQGEQASSSWEGRCCPSRHRPESRSTDTEPTEEQQPPRRWLVLCPRRRRDETAPRDITPSTFGAIASERSDGTQRSI